MTCPPYTSYTLCRFRFAISTATETFMLLLLEAIMDGFIILLNLPIASLTSLGVEVAVVEEFIKSSNNNFPMSHKNVGATNFGSGSGCGGRFVGQSAAPPSTAAPSTSPAFPAVVVVIPGEAEAAAVVVVVVVDRGTTPDPPMDAAGAAAGDTTVAATTAAGAAGAAVLVEAAAPPSGNACRWVVGGGGGT